MRIPICYGPMLRANCLILRSAFPTCPPTNPLDPSPWFHPMYCMSQTILTDKQWWLRHIGTLLGPIQESQLIIVGIELWLMFHGSMETFSWMVQIFNISFCLRETPYFICAWRHFTTKSSSSMQDWTVWMLAPLPAPFFLYFLCFHPTMPMFWHPYILKSKIDDLMW
jgi:hypothetical protein